MLITPQVLKRELQSHGCSLSALARAWGLSPQRIDQLMQAHGVSIRKTVVLTKKAKALGSRNGG